MPKMWKIDGEMQRWCGLILDEVAEWPELRSRPMFGMVGLYRGKQIFAAIPKTRALENDRSILIKRLGARGDQLNSTSGPGAGWLAFEIQYESDVAEALRQLAEAYKKATAGR